MAKTRINTIIKYPKYHFKNKVVLDEKYRVIDMLYAWRSRFVNLICEIDQEIEYIERLMPKK